MDSHSNKNSRDEHTILSDVFFPTLLERARIGALHLDEMQRITYVNSFANEFLGYEKGEVLGRNIGFILCPSSESIFKEHFVQHQRGGHSQYELNFERKDGSRREVHICATPDAKKGNTAPGLSLLFSDISKEKEEMRLLSLERDLSHKLSAVVDLKHALEICIDTSLETTCADSMGIYLIDELGDLSLAAHRGFSSSFVNAVSYFPASSPHADLVNPGKPLYLPFREIPVPLNGSCDDEGIRGFGIIPVRSDTTIVAVFNVASHEFEAFPPHACQTLETIAHRVSKSIIRLRMENKLRSLEDQYRLVVEHAQEAIFVVQNHRFLFSNPMFQKISGYSRAEVSNLVLDQLLHPDDRTLIKQVIAGAATDLEQDKAFRIRILPKCGIPVWCEVKPTTILWDGKPATLSFMTDITHRILAESELRIQKAYLEELFQGAPEAIVLLDNHDNVLRINREFTRLFGFSAEEATGQRINDLIVPKKFHVEGLAATQHVADGRTIELDTVRLHKNGTEINVSILGKPILLGKDQLAVYGIYRDITELKKAEEERQKLEEHMRRAQKLESLGALAGGIAHDFNNLLVGILGNANTALLNLPPDSPLSNSLRDIETSALRAADLTKQMLAYSGKGPFIVQPVDLSDLVCEMSEFLKVSVSKKVDIKIDTQKNLPSIEADATQLRQVVMSLMTNASEAIGTEKGTIRVATGVMNCSRAFLNETYLAQDLPEADYVYFEVEDTGCGMDENTKRTIFDPFFTTKFAGRGLGLAAVLGIVRGHNGAIHISSTEGVGSVFRIIFPRSESPEQTYDANHRPPQQRSSHGGRTILFVDDEELVRETAMRMLEGLNYIVVTANDGQEAVDIYRQRVNDFDLVILDMKMPHMDGDEAFRLIRKQNPEAKIILSSGYSERVVKQHFSDDIPAGFIQKPYRLADIQKKIESTLG